MFNNHLWSSITRQCESYMTTLVLFTKKNTFREMTDYIRPSKDSSRQCYSDPVPVSVLKISAATEDKTAVSIFLTQCAEYHDFKLNKGWVWWCFSRNCYNYSLKESLIRQKISTSKKRLWYTHKHHTLWIYNIWTSCSLEPTQLFTVGWKSVFG